MKVILINGKYRSGKDYFAQQLKTALKYKKNKKAEIIRFADPIKNILAITFDCYVEDINKYKNDPDEYNITINDELGPFKELNFREILQKFGTEAMQKVFGKTVWADLLEKELLFLDNAGIDYVLVPDFRFKHEYITPSITVNIFNNDIEWNDTHASETELKDFYFDYYVNNTGQPNLSVHIHNFIQYLENLKNQ